MNTIDRFLVKRLACAHRPLLFVAVVPLLFPVVARALQHAGQPPAVRRPAKTMINKAKSQIFKVCKLLGNRD